MGEERCERQNLKWDYFGINTSLFPAIAFSPCFAQWDHLVLPGAVSLLGSPGPSPARASSPRGCGRRGGSRGWCWRSSSSEQAPLAFDHLFDLTLSSNTRSFTACPGLPDEEVTLQRKEPAHAV